MTGAAVSFNFNSTRFIFWFYIKPQLFRSDIVTDLVASYFDSTSNHNRNAVWQSVPQLLHILILHQTTTCPHSDSTTLSCFISWFYIKPQPCTRWVWKNMRCFISWFYIKPQRWLRPPLVSGCCFISWFYIKPQQDKTQLILAIGCFISWFYIKPQQ